MKSSFAGRIEVFQASRTLNESGAPTASMSPLPFLAKKYSQTAKLELGRLVVSPLRFTFVRR